MDARRRSVLLLDDDPQICDAVSAALDKAGYEVTPVQSSMECWKLLDAGQRFDVLIIDIVMPPDTPHGLAVGRMVRAKRPDQKIIYVTGAEELPDELLEGPILRKPFHMDELLHAIERVLVEGSRS